MASFEYYSKGSEFCRKIDFTDAHSAAIRQRDATAPIVLCGFSGSGKSYLLKQIAHQFNRASCLDIDNIIEQRIGLPIDEVVQSIGWANFRPLETSILRQHIHIPKAVVALGAGGLTIPENRAIIRSLGSRVIYVYSGLKSCLARIRTGSRPLLLNKTDAELEALYEERKFLYFDNSDLIINNE